MFPKTLSKEIFAASWARPRIGGAFRWILTSTPPILFIYFSVLDSKSVQLLIASAIEVATVCRRSAEQSGHMCEGR